MGREARCRFRWGERSGEITILLESGELIVRGDRQRKVALDTVHDVHVDGDALAFRVDGEPVALYMGKLAATRWAQAIAAGPPSLARKLGIGAETRVAFVGIRDDADLAAALDAGIAAGAEPALLVVRAASVADIEAALQTYAAAVRAGVPIWIVYEKGRASALGETAIREYLRARDFVDTKAASVSLRLTGLRFVMRTVRP